MRERDIRHSVSQAHAADGALQSRLSPEPFDGETADEEDDARLQERELILQPRCAERDLGRRRPTIATPGPRLPREAFGDRRAIWKMVFVDSRFCQPAPQLRAARPLNGFPVVSSTSPGAWPMIAIRSRTDPATIGCARARYPASTHFVHARMRA